MWVSSDEALRRLNVKPQTLYANVSRGRIKAKPDPGDPRRSLYSREDVDRLARRSQGRPRTAAVAAEAIRWGDPVLNSAVSTIASGRLYYRGKDAASLAETATLEEVAGLLWQQAEAVALSSAEVAASTAVPLGAAFAVLSGRAAVDIPSYGRSPSALRADAAEVLSSLAAAIGGPGQGAVHVRLAARWDRPEASDLIRRTFILLADHELNASTFATRVAVSTGASLAAGALAGLAALTGPLHGSAAVAVQSLARRAAEIGADAAVRERLAEGRPLPAFGHQLYPDGDIRAANLLAAFEVPEPYGQLAQTVESMVGERPNIDFALAALSFGYDFPPAAPIQLFALARAAGWLAHALEQAETGALIRPRARYIGVLPAVP